MYSPRQSLFQLLKTYTVFYGFIDKEVTFTEGEQQFYQEKGFSNPVRCAECRKARKQQNN